MVNENVLYFIIYIPLLASIATSFFSTNRKINRYLVYFVLILMFLLSLSAMKLGTFTLSYEGTKYFFDNYLYSNATNVIILAVFLAIKIFFRIKNHKTEKNISYPIYYVGIFSFAVACLNINICNSVTFFVIYLLSEYKNFKTA